MIEPFGLIVSTQYQLFHRMGFEVVREGDYCTILRSADKTIALTVEKYTPADIQLNFIGHQGEIYPLWMIRLIIDMKGYELDKDILNRIKNEYGLLDGCEGVAQFRKGVKLYAATYVELATKFLQKNLYLVNLNTEEFKAKSMSFSSI